MDENYTLETVQDIIHKNDGVMLYFSGENCGVCHALKPKVEELFTDQFSKLKQVYISADQYQEIAASFNVFTIPTVIVFFERQEFIRQSRHISMGDLQNKIERPYNLYFNE